MVRMFASMEFHMNLKMGHVWSKTRSLGQILGKAYVCSRGHINSWLPSQVRGIDIPKNILFFKSVTAWWGHSIFWGKGGFATFVVKIFNTRRNCLLHNAVFS